MHLHSVTEKLDPSKLVTSSGEFGRGRECVTNQYGQAVVKKCVGNNNIYNNSSNISNKICVKDPPPPKDAVCDLVDLTGTSADIKIDKLF